MDVITVLRGNRRPWVFRWASMRELCVGLPTACWNGDNGYYHQTTRNLYRLFMGDKCKPVWIGRYMADGNCWVTCEKEIRATGMFGCNFSLDFKDGWK